jgi:hypothetical protein
MRHQIAPGGEGSFQQAALALGFEADSSAATGGTPTLRSSAPDCIRKV